MKIIYQDQHFFAIDKPAGFFVHPPERSPYPVPKEKICLYTLRKKFNQEVFPVHRLDAPTTGLVLFSFDRGGARELGRLFMERAMSKTYLAVVRGYVESEGVIELPLEIDDEGNFTEAKTLYRLKSKIELPFAVGKKYPTSRYSLVEVQPITGRWHQIRRHFDRVAHPLLGDIEHGDSHHNRFFRDELDIPGLCLRATKMEFTHPWEQRPICIEAPPSEKWDKIHSLFSPS